MIFVRQVPDEPLRPFVEWLWYFADLEVVHSREHVLPNGAFELVIDLREDPHRMFHRQDTTRYDTFRGGWISGAHSQYIIIDALPSSSLMGVHFRPGGASPFLECPADELRDQVVEMDAVWGIQALRLREQLLEAPTPPAKFRLLEQFLLQRLARTRTSRRNRARVDWAIQQFLLPDEVPRLRGVADQLGISHKHFIDEFRRSVGLTPKLFCRIQRFQSVLGQTKSGLDVDWADVACRCGYFDQSHFVHDFQAFAGLSPSDFLQRRLDDPNFVPVS